MGMIVDLTSYFYWMKQARKYEKMSKKAIPLSTQIEWTQEAVKCEERAENHLSSVIKTTKLRETEDA